MPPTKKSQLLRRVVLMSYQSLWEKRSIKTVENLSTLSGVDEKELKDLFLSELKTTATNYLERQKLFYAFQILEENPDILICELSAQFDYKPNKFRNLFSKWFGLTPTEFKKIAKKK